MNTKTTTSQGHRPTIIKKIRKWERSFIRDRWGNLKDCYWNEMAKDEIESLERMLTPNKNPDQLNPIKQSL